MKSADQLTRALARAHNGTPWHGPSRADILADVTWKEAAWRPAEGAHSIWELVLHMRSWTREVERRALGGVPDEPVDGDWPAMPSPSAAAWKSTLASLDESHASLVKTVAAMTDDALAAKVKDRPNDPPGRAISIRSMISSLAEHDIYHSGQVAMMKRLARADR